MSTNDLLEELTANNQSYARSHFDPGLKMLPRKKTLILGCVDPRVDPDALLGLAVGDTVVIRNVGGRMTPDALATIDMLDQVVKAGGGALAGGWNLIVLHHTDCGIKKLASAPEMLSHFFGVPAEKLAELAIDNPHASVLLDVATVRARRPDLPVTGLVYDVATGLVEVVAPPR